MEMLSAIIKWDSVSLLGFPFRNHVQVRSCTVSAIFIFRYIYFYRYSDIWYKATNLNIHSDLTRVNTLT